MKTKIQGLLLNKRPFQENHLLGSVLLRNGRKVVMIFYGGRGGGKRNKPSLLELGYLLDLELAKSKKNSDLYPAKEWGQAWVHEAIRKNYDAYLVMCFFLEIIEKVAPEEDLWDAEDDPDSQFESLFRILSNSIFYLEKLCKEDVEKTKLSFDILVASFLGKLILEQGFFPNLNACCFSEEAILDNEPVMFMHELGGFAKVEFVKSQGVYSEGSSAEGAQIRSLLKELTFSKSTDLVHRKISNNQIIKSIFHYFCFQNQLRPDTFKTYKGVIS